jgi:hypothetical protein
MSQGPGSCRPNQHERAPVGPGVRLLAGRQGPLPPPTVRSARPSPSSSPRSAPKCVRNGRPWGAPLRYPVRDAGIGQYLDIGTGIPTAGNIHDEAQEHAPESRVLYADNDPTMLAHARALMGGTLEGRWRSSRTTCASRKRSWAIRPSPRPSASPGPSVLGLSASCTTSVTRTIRLGSSPPWSTRWRPAATWCYRKRPPTSTRTRWVALPRRRNRAGSQRARSFADTEPFFAGLELVKLGLVPLAAWRPDPEPSRIRAASTPTAGSSASPEATLLGLRRMAGCDFCC